MIKPIAKITDDKELVELLQADKQTFGSMSNMALLLVLNEGTS